MNAPQLPPESSFSKASVSETSPRTLSETVEFSPNLSPNLFVYFSSFLLLLLLFLLLCLLLKRKCLWSAWFRWLILPLKAVASSPERVETASRAAAAAAAVVDCEKKNEKRKKKKKTWWWWCYYSPLLLLLFKRAKRTHKSAFVFGCVVLSKLSEWKKEWRKIQEQQQHFSLMKSSQRARTRNFCGYCASSFPSKKAIIRAHNTCDALGGIKTYSSLSLSKLFYFIHKIVIILLRFPTSQRFHDALRGRWPRRFLIRSEHIPNRWDAHR